MSGSANFEDAIDAMDLENPADALGRPTNRDGQNSNTETVRTENEDSVEKYDLSKNAHVLVLHHYKYSDFKYTPRAGSEVDMETIKSFFSSYRTAPDGGLEVHDNPTLRQVQVLMDEVSRKNFSSCSCLIIIIMGHGGQDDSIVAKDGKCYSFQEDILDKVAINPTLLEKPKVFIVNACRGSSVVADAVPVPLDNRDTVIFQSTYEGHVSYRNVNTGSFFVQTFFELLRKNDHLNICELNTMLNELAATQENIQNPTMRTKLTMRLIFGDLRK